MPFARELASQFDVCAVQLPGRENRLREPAHTRLPELIEETFQALRGHFDVPYALFGHSMGALVAFEFARRLRAEGIPSPVRLFVAGHRAPQLPSRYPRLAHLTDAALLDEIRTRYGGVPEEVLRHPDLMALLLPCLRADMALLEGYAYEADEPLACPISVYGGVEDAVTTQAELEAWRSQTRGEFTLTRFPGDHFFVRSARSALISAVSRDLALVDARR
jgi:medium-chain acyl-[acyl-carrier-protein] hydrolase